MARAVDTSTAETLFALLPQVARDVFADLLKELSDDVLADERRLAPKDTGALEAALSEQLLVEQLKARIGLIGRGVNRQYFYGRIQNFGRRAQIVNVERRMRIARGMSKKRARLAGLVQRYKLRVRVAPPHVFIDFGSPEQSANIDRRLNEFWDRTLDQVPGLSS